MARRLTTELPRAVRIRLLQSLDDRIAAECRVIVENRLPGVQPIARAALLPSDDARAALAATLLGGLSRVAVAELLMPAINTERDLLLRFAGDPDAMLRETALDMLFKTVRGTTASQAVRDRCKALLAPGLTLLGAGADAAIPAAPVTPAPVAPAPGEADFVAALHADQRDLAQSILAAQSGLPVDKVAEAVSTRDARSLLGLAWRAGYSMRAARLLQTQLAGIPPNATIGCNEAGIPAMGRGEIAWQLALLSGD